MERFKSFKKLLGRGFKEDTALEFFVGQVRKRMTYGELNEAIDSYPLPKEKVVGLLVDNSPDCVLSILSLAGKRQLVLLNGDDDTEVLKSQIKATHVGVLLGDEDLVEELKDCLEKDYECADADILFFTSGTTSSSKAVVLTEASLCSAAYNGGSLLPLERSDSLLAVLPLSHVFGFVCSLLWPLSFGAKVYLGRGLKHIFFDFAEFKPSVTTLVPQMAGFLAAKNLFNKELRLILIGAGECPDSVLNRIKGLGIRVSFGYGLTETSSGIALSLGDNPREMTICPDYKVRIAEDSEIIVESDFTLMKGYYEDEEGTSSVKKGNVLYTGDLGKLENGHLFITGRKKEIIVFDDGSKLFIPEYEGKLASLLGTGSDFAIDKLNDGSLGLFVHGLEGIEDSVEKFNLQYPRSHRIAKIIHVETPLPRTKTGKVQRYLLKESEND